MDPLTPRQAAELLGRTPAVFGAAAALPDGALGRHASARDWCAKEVLGHVIEAEERGFAGRIRAILAERAPKFATWDQEAVARERRDCERAFGELLREFEGLRASSVALVAGLSDGDLPRSGLHPEVGELRVADLVHEWLYHDWVHTQQLFGCLQSAVWEQMANARRFYQE